MALTSTVDIFSMHGVGDLLDHYHIDNNMILHIRPTSLEKFLIVTNLAKLHPVNPGPNVFTEFVRSVTEHT